MSYLARSLLLKLLHHANAVERWHPDVEDENIRLHRIDCFQRVLPILGHAHQFELPIEQLAGTI